MTQMPIARAHHWFSGTPNAVNRGRYALGLVGSKGHPTESNFSLKKKQVATRANAVPAHDAEF